MSRKEIRRVVERKFDAEVRGKAAAVDDDVFDALLFQLLRDFLEHIPRARHRLAVVFDADAVAVDFRIHALADHVEIVARLCVVVVDDAAEKVAFQLFLQLFGQVHVGGGKAAFRALHAVLRPKRLGGKKLAFGAHFIEALVEIFIRHLGNAPAILFGRRLAGGGFDLHLAHAPVFFLEADEVAVLVHDQLGEGKRHGWLAFGEEVHGLLRGFVERVAFGDFLSVCGKELLELPDAVFHYARVVDHEAHVVGGVVVLPEDEGGTRALRDDIAHEARCFLAFRHIERAAPVVLQKRVEKPVFGVDEHVDDGGFHAVDVFDFHFASPPVFGCCGALPPSNLSLYSPTLCPPEWPRCSASTFMRWSKSLRSR